jgi:tetratricopeptide (TPR) repeat protein
MITRRNFLIKVGNLSVVTSTFLFYPSILKADEFKKSELSECTFHGVYPTSFLEKSYLNWVVTGSMIVGGIAFSYFTAGAGAPAAESGIISWIASTIGGGGAGSYMAGLSMIGSAFGGNAILGAAILNGTWIGTVGGTVSLAGKIGLTIDMSLTGVYILKGEDNKIIYKTEIFIPEGIGDDYVQNLVKEIYDIRDNIRKAQEDQNNKKIKELFENLSEKFELANNYLLKELYSPPYNIDNVLVLTILAYDSNHIENFLKGMKIIEKYDKEIGWKKHSIFSFFKKDSNENLDNFVLYLKAIKELVNGNKDNAICYLNKCSDNEKYIMESDQMLISLYSETKEEFKNNLFVINCLIESVDKNFDPDKYHTDKRNKSSFFLDIGLKFYIFGYYSEAIKYLNKAYDELGLIAKHMSFIEAIKKTENLINIYKALCYLQLGNIVKANEIYQDVLESSGNEEKEQYKKMFESEMKAIQ